MLVELTKKQKKNKEASEVRLFYCHVKKNKNLGWCFGKAETTPTMKVRSIKRNSRTILTFMALMADLVMEIIFARDIGGLESISEKS